MFAILILVGIAAFLFGVVWLAYKLSTIFYGWLSQRTFFVQLRQRREARRMAQPTRRRPSFGAFLVEVFAEPILLTVAVVMLYDHFKSIWSTSPNIATFWARINESTWANVLIAIFFLIAVLLWMLVLLFRRDREAQRDKAFEESQKANTDKLTQLLKANNDQLKEAAKSNSEQMRQITESITQLAKEIGENREDKHGKLPTGM